MPSDAILHLTVEEVIAIHDALLQRFGGPQGVRDPGLLESALYRPQTGYYADIAEMATAHDNFQLYDYAAQGNIVLDLSRYKDTGHFDHRATQQIARELTAGTGPTADLANINSKLLEVRSQVDASTFPCPMVASKL